MEAQKSWQTCIPSKKSTVLWITTARSLFIDRVYSSAYRGGRHPPAPPRHAHPHPAQGEQPDRPGAQRQHRHPPQSRGGGQGWRKSFIDAFYFYQTRVAYIYIYIITDRRRIQMSPRSKCWLVRGNSYVLLKHGLSNNVLPCLYLSL